MHYFIIEKKEKYKCDYSIKYKNLLNEKYKIPIIYKNYSLKILNLNILLKNILF